MSEMPFCERCGHLYDYKSPEACHWREVWIEANQQAEPNTRKYCCPSCFAVLRKTWCRFFSPVQDYRNATPSPEVKDE